MKNLKNLNTTTMIALSLLLSTGVSSLNIDNFGQIVNVSYAAEKTTVKTQDKNGKLNLREKANTSSAVKATIPNGTELTIEDKSGAWFKVTYYGVTGWISSAYTTHAANGDNTDQGSALPANTVGTVKTQGGNLIIRANISVKDPIKGYIPNGTTVTLLRSTPAWYQVNYNGIIGWCSRTYIPDSTVKQGSSNNSGSTSDNLFGAEDITDKTYYVTGNNVNRRTGPGTSYSSLGTYDKGTSVKVTHKKVVGKDTWYRTSANEWILGTYLSTTNPVTSSAPFNTEDIPDTTYYVTGNNVNRRTGPGTNYSSAGTYDKGTSVKVTHKTVIGKDTWYKTSANEWILGTYLSSSKPSTSTSTSTKAIESSKNCTVRPVKAISSGSTDINNMSGSKVTFSASKNYLYTVDRQAILNGQTYYRVKALSSNLKVWIPSSSLKVEAALNTQAGQKYYLRTDTYLYQQSELTSKISKNSLAAHNSRVKIEHISTKNSMSVNVAVIDPNTGVKLGQQGWINKGALKTTVSMSLHSNDINTVNVKDMFSDVYALDSESQSISMQAITDNDDYLEITGVPSKPYLVQLDLAQNESDPFYITQYFVDITSKDGVVTTLRFDPSDFNLIKALYSSKEITLYADPTTTEDAKVIPMIAMGTNFINSDYESNLNAHISPLSDADIVGIMIEDFTNLLSGYSITVNEFSQEDIDAIVKEINSPKVDKTSATIGGENTEVTIDEETSKDNSSEKSSSSLGNLTQKLISKNH